MQRSSLTDKSLQLKPSWNNEKFRDVRKRAKLVEEERVHKAKKYKHEITPTPEFKIDDVVVVSQSYRSNKEYMGIKIIDVCEIGDSLFTRNKKFDYFGIIVGVTNEKSIENIGHLFKVSSSGWRWNWVIENVPFSSIHWYMERKDFF
jgi:hypothetical protein